MLRSKCCVLTSNSQSYNHHATNASYINSSELHKIAIMDGNVPGPRGKKIVFKVLVFFTKKNSKGGFFLFLMVFKDIFRINFCGYYFFIIILFSIYMNLHSFSVLIAA